MGKTFEQDLKEAVEYHGHLCGGQILGVRMARLALETLEIREQKKHKQLIVYVECDRCLADAIGTVTGCKLGKRSLKWMDYGKMAASFLDISTKKAIRIHRKKIMHPPEGADLIEFYEKISDQELFEIQQVTINYGQEDLPGKPLDIQTCQCCGEEIMDGRQIKKDGILMCRACGTGAYYKEAPL